jgi:hypothetical protein
MVTKKLIYINQIYDLDNALMSYRDTMTNSYPDFEVICLDANSRQYLVIIKQ